MTVPLEAVVTAKRNKAAALKLRSRYRLATMGKAGRIMAIAAAHHRLNFIHPFPDGNGRVSRLMSHAVALSAEIGARLYGRYRAAWPAVSKAEANISA